LRSETHVTRAAHQEPNVLRLKRLGIDTYQELVIFMASECPICRSEGWGAQSRVKVSYNGGSIVATLNVTTDSLLALDEASLSEAAWHLLGAKTGDLVRLSQSPPVERPLDFDSGTQLVASVLSKKAAAGSTQVVIDIPIGPTAKVRSITAADVLESMLLTVGTGIGLSVRVVRTDGTQPVGRGIGPALEARDVLSVLRRCDHAPADLRDRSLALAGVVLEIGGVATIGTGRARAQEALETGAALRKFEAICAAQGGMREPAVAPLTHVVHATRRGRISGIDNRRLARLVKLAGAPRAASAGVELHARLGAAVGSRPFGKK